MANSAEVDRWVKRLASGSLEERIDACKELGALGDAREGNVYSGDWLARKALFDFDRVEIRRASEMESARWR